MSGTDFKESQWLRFAAEVDLLARDIKTHTSLEDFYHLKKMEGWGRLATTLGYLTSWILPNPVSAWLLSQGNFTRWALVFHPISHGAMNPISGVPKRYTSKHFAQGLRRFIDWPDWIKPEHWHLEHDQLHHYHLGTDNDPDVVWRNAEKIRTLPVPLPVRTFFAVILACVWKPLYYAPNTVMESRHYLKLEPSNRISGRTWNPLTPTGRELWFGCLIPYASFRFVLIPMLFLPLGTWAVFSVFLNSVLAELLTNLYSFMTIGPNHTGDDIFVFDAPSGSRAEFYLRQIIGSVNYTSPNDLTDFLYGGLNYQIEHHLFPTASLLQCKRVQPKLKELCARYGVPYVQASLISRVAITFRTLIGTCGPKQFSTDALQERTCS